MQVEFGELFGELHGVGERPLMSSDFPRGGPHEDSANFIDNQYFGDVVRISPHDSKFLCSPFPVELGDRLRVANSHDIEDTIKSSRDAFCTFIPNLKDFTPLTGHNRGTAVAKDALDEHVFLEEMKLLDEVARRHLDRVYYLVLVGVYYHQLV